MTEPAQMPEPAPEIEFWFEFASTYSYLSVMRIEAEARRLNVRIVWRPFLLGAIFKAIGADKSPFLLNKDKGTYMWQDMQRMCRKYGLTWQQPSVFPRQSLLAARVALIGSQAPWIGAFSRQVMECNFGRDEDISKPAHLKPILDALGLPADAILDEARNEATKILLRKQTELAHSKGIFGAPTFFVGTEMFWGNDRLEDAVLLASQKHW